MAKKSTKSKKSQKKGAPPKSQAAVADSILDSLLQSFGLGTAPWTKYHDIARAHGINRPTLTLSLADSKVHPIHMAADEGNIAALNAMLDAGADIEIADECGFTPLKYAARYNQPNAIRLLLSRGANVRGSDERGLTALHLAAESGSRACCEILIAAGADVLAKTTGNAIPLHNAAFGNSADCCRLLVAHGAVINAQSIYGDTPLHLGAEQGSLEACCYLLDVGADIFAKNGNGRMAVDLAPPNSETKAFLDQAAQSRRLRERQVMAPSRRAVAL